MEQGHARGKIVVTVARDRQVCEVASPRPDCVQAGRPTCKIHRGERPGAAEGPAAANSQPGRTVGQNWRPVPPRFVKLPDAERPFSAMSRKRPAMPAHGWHTQITLFDTGLAESQQTEAGAHIGGSGTCPLADADHGVYPRR